MALTLQVTSFQHQALGSQATKTFGAQGGTIGRRNDNDWVLPDPERFISSRHAQIVCRGGVYYVCDLSVNGTFVNGSAQPIGNGSEQPLNEGDRLQIGEYEIAVRLDAREAASMTGPGGYDPRSAGAYSTGPSTPGWTGQSGPTGGGFFGGQDSGQPSAQDPLDFFADRSQPQQAPPPAAPDHASAMDQFFEPPGIEPPRPAPQAPPAGAGGGIPEDWDKTGFASVDPPAPSPSPADPFGSSGVLPPGVAPQPPPVVSPPSGDAAGMLTVLLQHAGMDVAGARAAAANPAIVQALGTLLGVVVQGMLEVLKARSEIKSQFRVPVTMMRPVENNPLKFSATPAQALDTLLQQRNQAYMGPVDAFIEGFQDVKAHQVAMMAGMRAAFDSMIDRFNPEELVERFEKRGHRGLLAMPGKGRYWEMYTDLYEEWTQDADLNFQKLFGDEFARAYEEQMRRLTSARKGGL